MPTGYHKKKTRIILEIKHFLETKTKYTRTHTHMVWSYPGAQLGSVFAMFPPMTAGCLIKVLNSVLIVA